MALSVVSARSLVHPGETSRPLLLVQECPSLASACQRVSSRSLCQIATASYPTSDWPTPRGYSRPPAHVEISTIICSPQPAHTPHKELSYGSSAAASWLRRTPQLSGLFAGKLRQPVGAARPAGHGLASPVPKLRVKDGGDRQRWERSCVGKSAKSVSMGLPPVECVGAGRLSGTVTDPAALLEAQMELYSEGFTVLKAAVPPGFLEQHVKGLEAGAGDGSGAQAQGPGSGGGGGAGAGTAEELGGLREAVLALVGDEAGEVEVLGSRVQRAGAGCTVAPTAVSPWWGEDWEVAGLDIHKNRATARVGDVLLVVPVKDTSSTMGGSLAVFPRSHWLVADWLEARGSFSAGGEAPQPADVPSAAPQQLALNAGDVVVCHPLLGLAYAPNVSSTDAHFVILRFSTSRPSSGLDASRAGAPLRADDMLWGSWPGFQTFELAQTREVAHMAREDAELQEEEEKATRGNWAVSLTVGAEGGRRTLEQQEGHSPIYSWVNPRDRVAWQMRRKAEALMGEGKWEEALVPLRRLAGLRPQSFWPFFQAGRCTIYGTQKGQLRGRAGRKCLLEDGERYLMRAIELAPGWPPSYAALAQALVEMGRGREQEVHALVRKLLTFPGLNDVCAEHPEAAVALVDVIETARDILGVHNELEQSARLWHDVEEACPSILAQYR